MNGGYDIDNDRSNTSTSRRSSLAISALLNKESVDPMVSHSSSRESSPSAAIKQSYRKTWHGFLSPLEVKQESSPTMEHDEEEDTMDAYPSPKAAGSQAVDTLLPDDEDSTAPSTTKAKRKRISPEQYKRLMQVFELTNTPSSEIREQLASELDMTKREVQVWFQNRRAKVSREKATGVVSGPPMMGNGSANRHRHHHHHHHHHHPTHRRTSSMTLQSVPQSSHPPPPSPSYYYSQHPWPPTPTDPNAANPPHILPRMSQGQIVPGPYTSTHSVAPSIPPTSTTYRPIHYYPSFDGFSPRKEYYDGHRSSLAATSGSNTARASDQSHPFLHDGIENLTLRPRDDDIPRRPARKRPKSAIDMLASAAEFIGASER